MLLIIQNSSVSCKILVWLRFFFFFFLVLENKKEKKRHWKIKIVCYFLLLYDIFYLFSTVFLLFSLLDFFEKKLLYKYTIIKNKNIRYKNIFNYN